MSGVALLVLAILVALIVWMTAVLWRQGFPESASGEPDEVGRGPVDARYPPGSRPAGPGAERMVEAPSRSRSETTEESQGRES